MILDLIYGYSKPLEEAPSYTKSKGREFSNQYAGKFLKSLLFTDSLPIHEIIHFEVNLYVRRLKVCSPNNGISVTCLRKSIEPITALNVATYVTQLTVRNFCAMLSCTYAINSRKFSLAT